MQTVEVRVNRSAIFWAVGAALFFLPFAARFFTGDDWLWLAEGMRTVHDPSLVFQRHIYGYFRPLSVALIAVWTVAAGGHALLYSLVSLILHGLNVWLLYRVAVEYDAERGLAGTAAFLSAFYYLNAPAITWISTTPDLIVTTLSLVFLLQTKRYFLRPTAGQFLLLVIVGLAAVLTKESGFVCLGLFFAVLLFGRWKVPSTPVRWHAALMVVIWAGYLAYYFATRTVVDKPVVIGWSALINVWYFLGYVIFPLSGRVAAMVPAKLHFLFVIGRVLSIAAVPVLLVGVWLRGSRAVRIFMVWCIAFVATISLFQWGVSLTSLYPERTASRYMYSVNFGFSVVAAWVLHAVWKKWLKGRRWTAPTLIVLAVVYLIGNFGIVYKVTQKYRRDQATALSMYHTVVSAVVPGDAHRLRVYVKGVDPTPSILSNPTFLEGMLLLGTGHEVGVVVDTVQESGSVVAQNSDEAVLMWDDAHQCLVKPGAD